MLNNGAMLPVAYTMSMAEREAVAKYLGVAGGDAPMPASAFCRDRAPFRKSPSSRSGR